MLTNEENIADDGGRDPIAKRPVDEEPVQQTADGVVHDEPFKEVHAPPTDRALAHREELEGEVVKIIKDAFDVDPKPTFVYAATSQEFEDKMHEHHERAHLKVAPEHLEGVKCFYLSELRQCLMHPFITELIDKGQEEISPIEKAFALHCMVHEATHQMLDTLFSMKNLHPDCLGFEDFDELGVYHREHLNPFEEFLVSYVANELTIQAAPSFTARARDVSHVQSFLAENLGTSNEPEVNERFMEAFRNALGVCNNADVVSHLVSESGKKGGVAELLKAYLETTEAFGDKDFTITTRFESRGKVLTANPESDDYYKCLGVHPAATEDEVKAAYKILSGRFHPDRQDGSERLFKRILEAYETLSDSEKRAGYDSVNGYSGNGLQTSTDYQELMNDIRAFHGELIKHPRFWRVHNLVPFLMDDMTPRDMNGAKRNLGFHSPKHGLHHEQYIEISNRRALPGGIKRLIDSVAGFLGIGGSNSKKEDTPRLTDGNANTHSTSTALATVSESGAIAPIEPKSVELSVYRQSRLPKGKYREWIADILSELPAEHAINPDEYHFRVIDNEHYGAKSVSFTNEDPRTVVVVGPNYGNHEGIYSVGPVILLRSHSMGPIISNSWIFADTDSFPRDLFYGKPILKRGQIKAHQATHIEDIEREIAKHKSHRLGTSAEEKRLLANPEQD